MATDTSKFIPADRLSLEQQPIDMKAPSCCDRSATTPPTSATGC